MRSGTIILCPAEFESQCNAFHGDLPNTARTMLAQFADLRLHQLLLCTAGIEPKLGSDRRHLNLRAKYQQGYRTA
jgi:hypothetical protein